MGEVKYRIISSDSELASAKAPELREELVILEGWLLSDGSAVALYEHELSTGDHDAFDMSDKVFDKFGQVIRLTRGLKQYEFLARTTRDGDGQRIWQSAEECKARLEPLGKSVTNKLVTAANKVNYNDDAESADEAVEDAEGK